MHGLQNMRNPLLLFVGSVFLWCLHSAETMVFVSECELNHAPTSLNFTAEGVLRLGCERLDCIARRFENETCRRYSMECKPGEWVGGIKLIGKQYGTRHLKSVRTEIMQNYACFSHDLYRIAMPLRTLISKLLKAGSEKKLLHHAADSAITADEGIISGNNEYHEVISNIHVLSSMNKMFTVDISRLKCRKPPAANGFKLFDQQGGGAIKEDFQIGRYGSVPIIIPSGCFHGSTLVKLEGGINKPIADVEVGDRVLAVSSGGLITFEPVRFILHREPNRRTRFIELQTNKNNTLQMTPKHLIFLVECSIESPSQFLNDFDVFGNTEFASDVRPGDCLLALNRQGQAEVVRVLSSKSVEATGVFNPLTSTGTIIANDLLASCYSEHKATRLLHPIVYFVKRVEALAQYVREQLFGNIGAFLHEQAILASSSRTEIFLGGLIEALLSSLDFLLPQ